MPRSPYAHGSWPKIRLAVLARDNYECQIRGKRCTRIATQADHIVPISLGGEWLSMDNLRGACAACNAGRVGHQYSRRWQSAITYVTVVQGDPIQTSQYVQTHSQPNDLIVDAHTLARTTGDPQAALTLWSRLVNQLRLGLVKNPRAWITTTGDVSRLPSHRVIKLGGDTPGIDAAKSASRHLMVAGLAKPSRIW